MSSNLTTYESMYGKWSEYEFRSIRNFDVDVVDFTYEPLKGETKKRRGYFISNYFYVHPADSNHEEFAKAALKNYCAHNIIYCSKIAWGDFTKTCEGAISFNAADQFEMLEFSACKILQKGCFTITQK